MELIKMSIVNTQLEIKGMGCNKCVERITESILKLPGIKSVEIDLNLKSANITYEDSDVDIPTILHAIEESGYSGIPK